MQGDGNLFMKELIVISGKGGTGKTSLMAAFSSLAENKVLVMPMWMRLTCI
jgi:MinD superfamily P-loop ATPase